MVSHITRSSLLSSYRPSFGTRGSLKPYKGVIDKKFIDILKDKDRLGPKQYEIVIDHLFNDLGVGALATKYEIALANVKQKLDNAAKAFEKALKEELNARKQG